MPIGKKTTKSPILFYVAGPYRCRWPIFKKIGIALNIWRARKIARKIWAAGHYAICPHLNTAFFDGLAPDENFLKGDLVMLEKCDALALVEGWEKSSGTSDEISLAIEKKIPVFYPDEMEKITSGWIKNANGGTIWIELSDM